MATRNAYSALLAALAILAISGCQWVPKNRLTAAEETSRALNEQVRGLTAELETVNAHRRHVEDQLALTEEQLARLAEQSGVDRSMLAAMRDHETRLNTALNGGPSSEVARRLAQIAERHRHLRYDPARGVARLETELMFDTGQAELRPEARRALDDLVELLTSPHGHDLRVMVAGHTDDRQVAKRPTRDLYPTNWHLSTARSLAVCQYMQARGVDGTRLGVAGFAEHQPIASNRSAQERQQNRRVEIFVMAPETPVVGWTDTMTGLY